jgi:hypothetical protein
MPDDEPLYFFRDGKGKGKLVIPKFCKSFFEQILPAKKMEGKWSNYLAQVLTCLALNLNG